MSSWELTHPDQITNERSYFQDQVQQNLNTRSRKKNYTHYLNIDSRYRRIENIIESRYIKTNPNYFNYGPEGLSVRISNPPQLILPTGEIGAKIPESIHFIMSWTSPNSGHNPTSVGGIATSELIYNQTKGGPTWYATLLGYDDEVDEASYRIDNLPEQTLAKNAQLDVSGGNQIQLRQILEMRHGFQHSNHYLISLKNPIRNVVSARLVSSEFPLPFHQPKILARTSYCSEISFPEMGLSRTINLPPLATDSVPKLLSGWAESVRNHLVDWDIEPLVHRDISGTDVYSVNLLQRIVNSSQVVSVYQLPFLATGNGNMRNQYSNHQSLGVNLSGQYDFVEGELVVVFLPDLTPQSITGIYRVVDGSEYRIKFQPNVEVWVEPKPGDSIWLGHEFIGWVISYNGTPDNHWLTASFEATGGGREVIDKGNRLHLGNHQLVFQVLDYTCLGPANQLHLDRISALPDSESIPTTPGIYHFEPFQLNHATHSSLHQAQLRDAESVSTGKDTGRPYQQVSGTLSALNSHSLQLDFPTHDLVPSSSGYEIHRVEYAPSDQFGLPPLALSRTRTVLSEAGADDTTHLYLDNTGPTPNLSAGQWVSCECQSQPSQYYQVVEYKPETTSVVLQTPHDTTRQIHSIKMPTHDLAVTRGSSPSPVTAHLSESVGRLDNKREIMVHYPSGNDDQFHPHFIIRVGKTIDGHHTTNAEMNIIKQVTELGDGTVKLQLYFPIENPHLQGDLVVQSYYYGVLSEYLAQGQQVLTLRSEFNLEKLGEVSGCLNWLSEMLPLDETAPEGEEFISEEMVSISGITTISEKVYQLHLRHPVAHNYPQRDAYLVLFIDPDLTPVPMSTVNCRHRGDWFTAIQLDTTLDLPNYLSGDQVQIYGMLGEDAPVYGLSRSDRVARGIRNLSLDPNQEHLSDLLTAPPTQSVVEIAREIPTAFQNLIDTNWLVVKGRYAGRQGSIRCLPQSYQPGIDWRYNQVVAHRDITQPGIATVQFARNFVPKRLRQGGQQVSLTVRPRESPEPPADLQQFPYFYLCCPHLPGIQLPNGSCDPYTAHLEWSFGQDAEQLQGRTKALADRDGLNHIFGKIQNRQDPGHFSNETMFNTYVDLPRQSLGSGLDDTVELEFTFLWPDGQLVDFQGRDHSFTLEIVEERDDLEMLHRGEV